MIRKITNEIKHEKLDNSLIINKYLDRLLNLQTNIMENNEGHIRDFSNKENIDEEDKAYYKMLIDDLDQRKKNIKKGGDFLNLSYILKSFELNIKKNWIWKEFSFNSQYTISVSFNNVMRTFIVFQKKRKKKLEKILKNI